MSDVPVQRAVQPPSISNVVPVTSDAAGDARKTTAPATSTWLTDPSKGDARQQVLAKRGFVLQLALAVPGVRMNVGATAFTCTPYGPHSTARHFVRCAMAAFVMQ